MLEDDGLGGAYEYLVGIYYTSNFMSSIYYMDKLYTEHALSSDYNSWWKVSEMVRVGGAALGYTVLTLTYIQTMFPSTDTF